MSLLVVIGAFVLLLVVLGLMGAWQRKIEEVQRNRVVADLREAEERGTTQAIAQHPQIDVRACIGCGSCVAACPEDGVLGLVDGVARVIHGARCIGHGRCEVVCPVNAIKVGLGDVTQRTDIPVLTGSYQTSMPGIYIAGELGGFALIRVAIEQGTRAMAEIDRELRATAKTANDAVDVLIVGGGPAGLAATLKAIECGLDYRTIDQDDIGGTVRKYPRRKLVLTEPVDLPLHGRVNRKEFLKEELIEFWEELISRYQLRIETGTKLLGAESHDGALVAQTSKGPIRTRRVLLALGRRGTPRRLGVPGEDSEKVLYQVIDTATYTNNHILVVGGGDSAVEAATGLANQTGNVVTLSYRRESFFRLKPRNAERIREYEKKGRVHVIFQSQVEKIDADSVLISTTDESGSSTLTVENEFVFILAGGEPPYPLMRSMGIRFGGDDEPAEAAAEQVGVSV